MQLAISRAGTQVLAGDPTFGNCDSPYCAPGGFGNRSSVAVEDLDADAEPEVIVDLYTGGAHCCFVSRFYRWDGAAYVPADRNFGDPGYRIADLDGDGVKELITADYRFGYAFTSFAASLMPVRIYELRAGKWALVTTRFPAQIRKDSKAAPCTAAASAVRRLPAQEPAQVRARPPEVPCQARLLSAGAPRSR
jgi:hypothetical protein